MRTTDFLHLEIEKIMSRKKCTEWRNLTPTLTMHLRIRTRNTEQFICNLKICRHSPTRNPYVGLQHTISWHHLGFLMKCLSKTYIIANDQSNRNNPLHFEYVDINYSTGVQIVSCTLSDDSVLSESTGLCNLVLCVSQWNLFWQQNQPIRLCLSNQVRHGRKVFPSPLCVFNRLFEGLIGELFKIWHWNMFYLFKWHRSGP